jgi:D-alanine-D-alanine ligase
LEKHWSEQEKAWFHAYAWPLTDQVWVIWSEEPEEWRPINHSCDPNTWLEGLDLVARRDISQGEEIQVDYATYGNNVLAPFDCTCGAPECRGRVREDDHLKPFLEAYGDHISDFVRSKRDGPGGADTSREGGLRRIHRARSS